MAVETKPSWFANQIGSRKNNETREFSLLLNGWYDSFGCNDKSAPLAQLAEQLTLNQWVPGSSPGGCTKENCLGKAMRTCIRNLRRAPWRGGIGQTGDGSWRLDKVLTFLDGVWPQFTSEQAKGIGLFCKLARTAAEQVYFDEHE